MGKRINSEKSICCLNILLISMVLSLIITTVTTLLFHNRMFEHKGQTIITDWSQCNYIGYEIDGQNVKSIAGDPCIYFFSDKNVEQVEVDVTMISNVENVWNRDFYGEEVIYAELFWADENGVMSGENSIPFKINLGRGSYLLDVDCPAGTLFRLDIGDGENVEFTANSFVFNTYEEYSLKEKIQSIIAMLFMTVVVISTGLYITTKKENK